MDEERREALEFRAKYVSRKAEGLIRKQKETSVYIDASEGVNEYLLTAYATIEGMTAEALMKFVIKDEVEEGAFEYLDGKMSQSHRETLLMDSGILSGQTKGKIDILRSKRNEVAHQPSPNFDWYGDSIYEVMEATIEIVDAFTEALLSQNTERYYKGEKQI